jgi:uncharacterized protein
MSLSASAYFQIVAQCIHSLRAMDIFLLKAEGQAADRKCDVAALLSSRLAPDMKPLIYQVQSACDYVKAAAAWLSGQVPPRHEDAEQTAEQLHERIHKTVAFAESVPAALYEGAADRSVSLSWAPGKVLGGDDYILQMTLPNVFFHIAIAYAILRHNGVELDKMDFLGSLNFVPA